jgi:AcrR family transcriptional regulator
MQEILSNLTIKVSEGLYQINPQTSKLGKNIVINSVTMIDEIGFEKFNFKKLGDEIGSPEASIYRYFKSKNQLLTYLISWYWGWMEYRLVLETTNIESADIRLTKSITLIASNTNEHIIIEGIDIKKLHQIIISESIKSYLTKDVDKANKEGAFHNYKQFVERISKIIQEINPEYIYPQMLITTIVEGVHLQVFFADHLPRLTNKLETPNYISDFYINLAINTIKGNK